MNSAGNANEMPMWNCSALVAPRSERNGRNHSDQSHRCALQAYGQCCVRPVQQLMGVDRRNCEASGDKVDGRIFCPTGRGIHAEVTIKAVR